MYESADRDRDGNMARTVRVFVANFDRLNTHLLFLPLYCIYLCFEFFVLRIIRSAYRENVPGRPRKRNRNVAQPRAVYNALFSENINIETFYRNRYYILRVCRVAPNIYARAELARKIDAVRSAVAQPNGEC